MHRVWASALLFLGLGGLAQILHCRQPQTTGEPKPEAPMQNVTCVTDPCAAGCGGACEAKEPAARDGSSVTGTSPASAPVEPSLSAPPPVASEPPPEPLPPPPPPPTPTPSGIVLYDSSRVHSPITPSVATHLRGIAGSRQRDARVLMKVGDSISYSWWFLSCFAPAQPNHVMELAAYGALKPTIDHFSQVQIAGTTPLDRTSLATQIGAVAEWATTGSPSPLDQEISATNPRFAVVMYGTNDLNYTGSEVGLRAWVWRRYAHNMFKITDQLIGAGIVPLLSTIPACAPFPTKVPVMNNIIRGVAQGRRVPLVDFFLASNGLPAHGLGDDGIHPSVYISSGVPRACYLTPEGLGYGYNMRNLVTLQAFDRLRQVVVGGATSLDASAPTAIGAGTLNDPIVIPNLPFTDLRPGTSATLASYACGYGQPGAETIYRLDLGTRTAIRALVLRPHGFAACADRDLDCTGLRDTSITLFSGAPTGASCMRSDNTVLTLTLDPGRYHFSVDAQDAGTTPALFIVMRCEPGDAQCQ